MKNSLFKRVAAAAAAVPLALTQCLTFSSVAAENDAVQIVGNTVQDGAKKSITLDQLLYIPANKTVSTWNITAASAIAEMVGTKGEIPKERILELADKAPAAYRQAFKAALKQDVLNNPVTYEVTADKDIVITAKVSQPDFNGAYGNTPAEALAQLADAYNAPELKDIDFSKVVVSGSFVVTIKTSELDNGTTVPVEAVYKSDADGDIYLGDWANYGNKKLAELEEVAKKAISNEVAAQYTQEATDKFLAKTALIRDKLNKANKAASEALTKSAEYSSVSEALTAVNNFLSKKNINKQVPTSASGIAALNTVKNGYNSAVNAASAKADIQITAEQLGSFIDSITSKSITDSEGNVYAATDADGNVIKDSEGNVVDKYADKATEFKITVANGTATLVGAFDDAEAADVQAYVENLGYEYIASYKKLTGTVDFTGVKTADTASVDVQIERILVTETTTTAPEETTTAPADETTTAPETTAPVETTTAPETTAPTEETTTAPKTTAPVETTTAPETTAPVETTTAPETTAPTEETTTAPKTTAPVETTTAPETTAPIETTTAPETTAPVETTTEPETTAPIETTTAPETTAPIETTTAPETTAPIETTTEPETTAPIETTTPAPTTSVKTKYVEVTATEGFYFNVEENFDKAQIEKVLLHTVYNEGYVDENGKLIVLREFESEPEDITADVTFGSATPANTYKAVENKFDYKIPLYYNGAVLKNEEGGDATVTVYIGVKGDTDLNNIVDGRDSTATLTYYARISTQAKDGTARDATNVALSPSDLVNGNPASVYDDFAAFLTDVQVDAGKNLTRFAKKTDRLIDGRDSTAILTYYAKSSVEQYKELAENDPSKLWNIVLGTES